MGKKRSIIGKSLKSVKAFFTDNSIELFPVKHAIKQYNGADARADLKASFNVALLALPQGMAYAAIAGLPIFYGIIAAAIAAIVAPLFSSARHTIQGPTNTTAFMVFSFFAVASTQVQEDFVMLMPLLVFMVGIISIIGALLKVADLLQYVSSTF